MRCSCFLFIFGKSICFKLTRLCRLAFFLWGDFAWHRLLKKGKEAMRNATHGGTWAEMRQSNTSHNVRRLAAVASLRASAKWSISHLATDRGQICPAQFCPVIRSSFVLIQKEVSKSSVSWKHEELSGNFGFRCTCYVWTNGKDAPMRFFQVACSVGSNIGSLCVLQRFTKFDCPISDRFVLGLVLCLCYVCVTCGLGFGKLKLSLV